VKCGHHVRTPNSLHVQTRQTVASFVVLDYEKLKTGLVILNSFIHSSLFAQKFQYSTAKTKGTELDEKVVKP